MNEGAVVSY